MPKTDPNVVKQCPDCKYSYPRTRTECPHCGRPKSYPNVNAAEAPNEIAKLERRYESVVSQAKTHGKIDRLEEFEFCCTESLAVFHCKLDRLCRNVATGTDLFETYYDLERLRLRSSVGNPLNFEKLRPQAEEELLGSEQYKNQLHYACLTIPERGLEDYGECAVVLAESMAAHRSSCFEGNTLVVYAEHDDFSMHVRSNWANRHKLCIAMFGHLVDLKMSKADFPAILVQAGATPVEDRFVEVQVFGPITLQTFKSISIISNQIAPEHSDFLSIVVRVAKEKNPSLPVEVRP